MIIITMANHHSIHRIYSAPSEIRKHHLRTRIKSAGKFRTRIVKQNMVLGLNAALCESCAQAGTGSGRGRPGKEQAGTEAGQDQAVIWNSHT